jgi:hypothetical protein
VGYSTEIVLCLFGNVGGCVFENMSHVMNKFERKVKHTCSTHTHTHKHHHHNYLFVRYTNILSLGWCLNNMCIHTHVPHPGLWESTWVTASSIPPSGEKMF